ncbi:hypothetical protein BV25DRAFT_717876 [Artomyces pyxidatus]|uniref:Uncharacterized protein n=1 Tax=Artomyces pyxidatus TaxID=48021 RepID=A0ACB8T0G4_9AGAM|nr:hypothetical protein BV25DRAFT_717876 [Artomyces pyxidatus]
MSGYPLFFPFTCRTHEKLLISTVLIMVPPSRRVHQTLHPPTTAAVVTHMWQCYLSLFVIFSFPLALSVGLALLLPPASFHRSELLQVVRRHPGALVMLYSEALVYVFSLVHGFFPSAIPFGRIVAGLWTRRRYRRSHIFHLRLDRFKRLQQSNPYTVFVVPIQGPSVPLVVSNDTTVGDVLTSLAVRGLQSASSRETHLYTSGRNPRALERHERLGDLAIGALSHLHVRCLVLGKVNL